MTLSNPAQYISGRTVQEQMNSLIDYVDARAAEVATDAIASDVAQVHQDMLDADADASAAAASAAAAAGTLANAVKKTGEASQSIAGDISIAGDLAAGDITAAGNVNGATIGGSATDMVSRDIIISGTAYIDNTAVNGNLAVTDSSALINMSGAGSVWVPDSTVGSYSSKDAVNAPRLKDELDNYAPMVRDTGNKTIAGTKTFTSRVIIKTNNIDATQPGTTTKHSNVDFRINDINDVDLAHIYLQQYADGRVAVYLVLRNTDGSMKYVNLGISDVI